VLSNGDLKLYVQDGNINFNLGTGTTVSGSLATGWHCVSMYYYADALSLAVDGATVAEATVADWTLATGSAWVLCNGYYGRLDEVCVTDTPILSHNRIYSQLVATDGWPVKVVGPYGNVPGTATVRGEKLSSKEDTWVATYPIQEPYLVREGSSAALEVVSDTTLASGELTLPDWVTRPEADYTVRWWYGVDGVVPDHLPTGKYMVCIAENVYAEGLRSYRESYLTDSRGFLTTAGEALVKQLGTKISWETMNWGTSLYFYKEAPPTAPTPAAWDGYLTYTEL